MVDSHGRKSKHAVSALFLFSCFLLTALVLILLIIKFTIAFTSTDEPVRFHQISHKTVKKFGGMPALAHIGLRINHFTKFDVVHDEFIFDGVLYFDFDPSQISLGTLEKSYFERGEILYRSEPTTKFENNRLFAKYNVRVKFTNFINFKYFPLDDHRLSIILANDHVSPSQLIFELDNSDFVVGQDMNFLGWNKINQNVESGYIELPLDQFDANQIVRYPVAIFTIDYGRYLAVRDGITIILPMLLLFFISLISMLVVDRERYFTVMITVPAQAIAGLIAYRFVLESISPRTGYFMFSDYFFYLFLVLMFAVLFVQTIDRELSLPLKRLIIISFCAIIILFFAYILLM